MCNDDRALLEEKLNKLYPGQFTRLIEPWEQSEWSKTFKAEFNLRDALYIKGTPRNRVEARITSLLHNYFPSHIPEILDEDMFPENKWRWFLLENAGECNHDNITAECAIQAAFHLGRLQSTVCHDPQLAKLLPQCRADGLQKALSGVCGWAVQSVLADKQDELIAYQVKIGQAAKFFDVLQEKLAHLPSTCVHGDFWSGNIACRENNVSFIDWGDALWGVGSISIVNLIWSANGDLSSVADKIWEAYSRGWGKDIAEDFIRSSQTAALVGSLVVDVEIAKCCNGSVKMIPSLFPNLQALSNLWA